MKRELSELEEVSKVIGSMQLIAFALILLICFLRYPYIKREQLLQTEQCDFNVITVSGIPSESADKNLNITGRFFRSEGNIEIRKNDNSVINVKDCLIGKGYSEKILSRIAQSK
ncbi:hypothetical protein H2241_19230 [Pantoea ananatis]|uniref:hypothetical protein n=1 Tax=Pantoea ananas TaxID=553 RepID=UPI00158A2A37|nr:hypothetical protein [Pantoea ananatis]MBA4823085.1 hypothetical protein [Pantoea ananatis]QKV88104.1 hypothetical protein FOB88_13705 [Pantoea ananatis]